MIRQGPFLLKAKQSQRRKLEHEKFKMDRKVNIGAFTDFSIPSRPCEDTTAIEHICDITPRDHTYQPSFLCPMKKKLRRDLVENSQSRVPRVNFDMPSFTGIEDKENLAKLLDL